jgi:hypothetical protein
MGAVAPSVSSEANNQSGTLLGKVVKVRVRKTLKDHPILPVLI